VHTLVGSTVHAAVQILTFGIRAADHCPMKDGLRHAIANGEYRIDPDVVAAAMIARAHAARVARRALARSEVLVAGDALELCRADSGECQSLPLEGAA
jgi:hypothetical protein